MDQNFLAYLDLLELLLFFSGYPLVYLLVTSFGETKWSKQIFKSNISRLLPFAYALAGVLYLGLQLKNLYPDYSVEHIKSSMQTPYLKIWALLSILFFVPLLNKKIVFSLLHSSVFFYFILRDLFLHVTGPPILNSVKNDMNIYSISLLINLATFLFIFLLYAGYRKIKTK